MKIELKKIFTSVLQNELNKRNDKNGQLEIKYGKTLKELNKKYKKLEKSVKMTVPIAGVNVYCNIYWYDGQVEIEVDKVTSSNRDDRTYFICHAFEEYLYNDPNELERIAQVSDAMDKMNDEFDNIMKACNKLGKEFGIDGEDIFESYIQ